MRKGRTEQPIGETVELASEKLSTVTSPPELDPRLPRLEGGWEFQQRCGAKLWVPKQPDALFDPDAHVERHAYHGTMPYWAWVWDAVEPSVEGLVRRQLTGRVLEVGAGLGALGIAWALAVGESTDLTMTDYDPVAIAAMRVNADLNGLLTAQVCPLDWRRAADLANERFDFVVGCEVIYDPTTHAALLDVIERCLEPSSGRALIFDPGRAPAAQFVRRAEKRGFAVSVEGLSGREVSIVQGQPRWLQLRIG